MNTSFLIILQLLNYNLWRIEREANKMSKSKNISLTFYVKYPYKCTWFTETLNSGFLVSFSETVWKKYSMVLMPT